MLLLAMDGAAPAPDPDRELARLLGEPTGLPAIVRAVIARILRAPVSHADVEDCAHETFARAIEGRSRLQPGCAIQPWVLGIARHVAQDMARQRARQHQVSVDARARVVDGESVTAEPSPTVLAALRDLPDGQQRALVLYHVEGRSYREIAELLDVPIGTVGTWLLRARQALVATLGAARPEAP